MPANSDAWEYFRKLSSSQAECQVCKKKLSLSGGSTKGLWTHLRTTHTTEYKKCTAVQSETAQKKKLENQK